jgi:hypothetical protein
VTYTNLLMTCSIMSQIGMELILPETAHMGTWGFPEADIL